MPQKGIKEEQKLLSDQALVIIGCQPEAWKSESVAGKAQEAAAQSGE